MRQPPDTGLKRKQFAGLCPTPVSFLRKFRKMIVAQMRHQIFLQTIQIEEARVAPLLTKFVKCDGIDASNYITIF